MSIWVVNEALDLVFILASDFLGHSVVGVSLASKETSSPDIKRGRSHDKATDDGNEGV